MLKVMTTHQYTIWMVHQLARLKTLRSRLYIEPKPRAQASWGNGRGGRPWRRLRDRVLLRDQYTCQCCGYVDHKLEVDHIVNKARGGTDDESNLQALCSDCHKTKTQAESKS
jgi:5-methylcytosine-specific restriction protein A